MWRIPSTCLSRWKLRRYRRLIENVLAKDCGTARCDGLRLSKFSSRLEICWRARDIHPWDRNRPLERRAALFVEQSLADTEGVITRLFDSLPQLVVIDLAVREPESEENMLAGTVLRSAWMSSRRLLSVQMRLREQGVDYRLAGSSFEPLGADRSIA